MLVDSKVLQYINKLPDHCVYAVVSEEYKTVYINHTSNLTTKLREVSNFGDKVMVLSSVSDKVYKLIHCEFYALQYINRGYRVVNRISPFFKLKPVLRISDQGTEVLVYLSTGRREKIVVGVFKYVKEAQNFKDEFYSARWDGLPVYANNSETRKYYSTALYKQARSGSWERIKAESNKVTQA